MATFQSPSMWGQQGPGLGILAPLTRRNRPGEDGRDQAAPLAGPTLCARTRWLTGVSGTPPYPRQGRATQGCCCRCAGVKNHVSSESGVSQQPTQGEGLLLRLGHVPPILTAATGKAAAPAKGVC
jgi:hypothetical protein